MVVNRSNLATIVYTKRDMGMTEMEALRRECGSAMYTRQPMTLKTQTYPERYTTGVVQKVKSDCTVFDGQILTIELEVL